MLQHLRRRLRPMGFADILDEAFELYKKNFLLLFLIGACAYVPLALIQAALGQPMAVDITGAEPSPAEVLPSIGKLVVYVILYWLAVLLATGALTFATSDIYLERPTSAGSCYRRVAKPGLMLSFIWANVLMVLAVLGAAIPAVLLIAVAIVAFATTGSVGPLGVVLGVVLMLVGIAAIGIPLYVGSRLAVYTPAFFIEGGGAMAALQRSWQLIKGRAAATFGMLFVVSLVILILKAIVESPVSLLLVRDTLSGKPPNSVALGVSVLYDSLVEAVLMPINSLVLILIYYDARIRKEGFDLEMLAADLDRRSRELTAYTQPLPQEPQSVPPPTSPEELQ